MDSALLFTDGGSRHNPGPAAVGYVLKTEGGQLIKKHGEYLGRATNNEAEYKALITGLTAAQALKVRRVVCFLDSLLVVNQLNGVFKTKEARLRELIFKVKSLEQEFDRLKYEYIPREKNLEADALVNKTLDERGF